MFKRCNVVMIPSTEQVTKNSLCLNSSYSPGLSQPLVRGFDAQEGTPNDHLKPQHLYILSDDEIKLGDWISDGKNIYFVCVLLDGYINLRKIIATTNINGTNTYIRMLPSIPESFIEKYISAFNNGNVIEEIRVEYEEVDNPKFNRNHGVSAFNPTYLLNLLVNPDNNTITIKDVKKSWTEDELYSIMQQYMEHCNFLEYVTPQKWLKDNA